jgi:hypothetical protein
MLFINEICLNQTLNKKKQLKLALCTNQSISLFFIVCDKQWFSLYNIETRETITVIVSYLHDRTYEWYLIGNQVSLPGQLYS